MQSEVLYKRKLHFGKQVALEHGIDLLCKKKVNHYFRFIDLNCEMNVYSCKIILDILIFTDCYM